MSADFRQAALRIVIADDSDVVRQSLTDLLSDIDGFDVVGLAGGGEHVIELAEELEPDVVVMDMRMPDVDGIEAARNIVERDPDVAIVMHSAYADAALVEAAERAGAGEFLVKGSSARMIAATIFAAACRNDALAEQRRRPIGDGAVGPGPWPAPARVAMPD